MTPDWKRGCWEQGVGVIQKAVACSDEQARKILGRWVRLSNEDHRRLYVAICEAWLASCQKEVGFREYVEFSLRKNSDPVRHEALVSALDRLYLAAYGVKRQKELRETSYQRIVNEEYKSLAAKIVKRVSKKA